MLDGQHRLQAAKELGLGVYYVVLPDASPESIPLLNCRKQWGLEDYIHFYKETNPNYQALEDFVEKHKIPIRTAISVGSIRTQEDNNEFRLGNFVFNPKITQEQIDIIKNTIEIIKNMSAYKVWYTKSGMFWRAMYILINAESFDEDHWYESLAKQAHKMASRATCTQYFELFCLIYNYRLRLKASRINPREVDLYERIDRRKNV